MDHRLEISSQGKWLTPQKIRGEASMGCRDKAAQVYSLIVIQASSISSASSRYAFMTYGIPET